MPHTDIRRTNTSSAFPRISGRTLVPFVALLAIASLNSGLVAQTAKPQDPGPADLRFEVASVKAHQQTLAEFIQANRGSVGGIGIRTLPGGRMTASFTTLRALILRALEIKEYQLEGGPAWIGTTNFEIDARANRDATPQEFNAMLKALLIERFALRTRSEVRQVAQYELTLVRTDGRLGSSLKPTSAECVTLMEERRKSSGQPPLLAPGRIFSDQEMRERMRTPQCGISSMTSMGAVSGYTMGGLPLSNLVARLSTELNAPVIDRTGLTGPFDAALEYEPPRRQVTTTAPPSDVDFSAPPLRTALQQQLGIRMEEVKGPLEIVVIESVQAPTPD